MKLFHSETNRVEKIDGLYMFFLVFIIGIVYYNTLLPGVGFYGDTSKFQFVGKVLGTPHPTGYPTYTVLNYLFVTFFPFGSLAFKANLLSSVFTILAALTAYRLIRLLSVRPVIAFALVLAFCLGVTVWVESIIAEVYSLNLLFVSLVSFFFIRWNLLRSERDFYWACLFYALSFGNHLIMITMLPAIFFLVAATDKMTFRNPSKILFVLFAILLGAGQYAYIVWRTLSPDTVYLETRIYDLQGFMDVVSGGRYSHQFFLRITPLYFFKKVVYFIYLFIREQLLLFLLPLFGMIKAGIRPVKWFLILSLFGNLIVSFSYEIGEIWAYLIPSYFFALIFSALAVNWLINHQKGKEHPAAVAWILLFPLVCLFYNFSQVDMSHQTQIQEYTEHVLKVIDSNAVIIEPEYTEMESLNYYLLGFGMSEERNITMLDFQEAVSRVYRCNHLSGPCIPVYVLEDKQIAKLANSGIFVEECFTGLYEVKFNH